MGWIQFTVFSVIVFGLFEYSSLLSTASKNKHSLLTDTTSASDISVLQGILNQESLVRFSMVQKIQNLVMNVLDIKTKEALFAENFKTVLSEIRAFTAENQKHGKDISQMKKILANSSEDIRELKIAQGDIRELRKTQEDGKALLLSLQKDFQNYSDAVNQTLSNIRETQIAQDTRLRNMKGQLLSLTKTLENATLDMLVLEVENQNQSEEIAELKNEIKDIKSEGIRVDCADILKRDPSTKNQDGVYTINPDNSSPRKVFCDMTTSDGGWTVIQNRIDGSTDFYRTWNEYKEGFGNSSHNYWIGNDMIHLLTKLKTQKLRVELQRFNGEKGYAEYSTFALGDETSKYKMTVSGFNGNISNHLHYHNGMKFSTWDQDNDEYSGSCSREFYGAWWYKECYYSNLNGRYLGSPTSDSKSNTWRWPSESRYQSLKTSRMMIRPSNL